MNVVDSSGWLEHFADGPNAPNFSPAICKPRELLVPSITITEVFKRILQQRDEPAALQAAAHMMQGDVVELDAELALKAARIGFDLKIPLADSILLATARRHNAILWTQDEDFKGIPGVRYIPKR